MSAVKRTWKLEYSQGNKNWTRIVRSEELKIGSRLGNHLRLPSPCPDSLLVVQHTSKGLDWETPSKAKCEAKKHKGAVVLQWNRKTLTVTDVTEEEHFKAFTHKNVQIERTSTLKDPTKKTVWFFHKGLLIETAPLESTDPKSNSRSSSQMNPKAHLGSGIKLELDMFSKKLIVSWATGDLRSLPLKNSDIGMEVSEGDYHFIISSAPDVSQLGIPVEKEKTKMAPVVFTVMATFLILLAMLQFNWSPDNGLMEEVLPEELAKMTIEKKEKSGLPGGGSGGGGVQTEKRDPRGGSGIASPDEVLVKNLNVAASSGNLLGALSALDNKYSKTAKAAIGAVGVGGPNAAQGILKSLGSMMASGGAGVGIGGLGTKGFGGGGGGGNGLGFGTKTGNGVGEGKELRAISFESGAGDVRGGLEKSEVEAVIRQNLAQIRNCYNRGLRLNPTLSGKVKASFRITAGGTVENSRIGDSTLASSEVEDCIRGRITSWNFPLPRGGSTVDVSYPFLLRPQ